MDDIEKLLQKHREEKRKIFHSAVAECKLIDTDRPEKKYLEFSGIRYVFEDVLPALMSSATLSIITSMAVV